MVINLQHSTTSNIINPSTIWLRLLSNVFHFTCESVWFDMIVWKTPHGHGEGISQIRTISTMSRLVTLCSMAWHLAPISNLRYAHARNVRGNFKPLLIRKVNSRNSHGTSIAAEPRRLPVDQEIQHRGLPPNRFPHGQIQNCILRNC